MSEDLDNQLSKYLEGTMTDSDRESFEKKLSNDPSLAEEVKDLKALEEGLQAVGVEAFLSDTRAWEQDMNAGQSYDYSWGKYLGVAAVISLILIPVVYFVTAQEPTSDELFLAYYEPYEELILSRGNTVDSLNILLTEGMEAYNNGDYQRCSELLETYLQQQPEAHRVALYLAIAQLELDQKDLAEANFVRAQEDPVFKEQAQWYQALSYLKFSEPEKARVILESIVVSERHYRKNEANRLLQELG